MYNKSFLEQSCHYDFFMCSGLHASKHTMFTNIFKNIVEYTVCNDACEHKILTI